MSSPESYYRFENYIYMSYKVSVNILRCGTKTRPARVDQICEKVWLGRFTPTLCELAWNNRPWFACFSIYSLDGFSQS